MPEISKKLEAEIIEAYKMGANEHEVCLETGIEYEDLISWLGLKDNSKKVERLKLAPVWEAKKIFFRPKDHKEAEAVLKRHPASKKDYSERVEATGAFGGPMQIELSPERKKQIEEVFNKNDE